jgi:uncharacterized membrane protein YhaH (DUF805 family)
MEHDDEFELNQENGNDQDMTRMPWIHYLFNPKTRMGRASYFSFSIPLLLTLLGFDKNRYFIDFTTSHHWSLLYRIKWDLETGNYVNMWSIPILVMLLIFTIKRINDANISKFWMLVTLIPYLGSLWLVVILILSGAYEKENRFGKSEHFRKYVEPEIDEEILV